MVSRSLIFLLIVVAVFGFAIGGINVTRAPMLQASARQTPPKRSRLDRAQERSVPLERAPHGSALGVLR
jgi:hypothetical protein